MTLARSRFAPRTLLLATALVFLAFAGSARAADIQVTNSGDAPGTCPDATNCTLRAAMESANSGDVIHVPAFHIVLGGDEIYTDASFTVVGAGAQNTIVDGNGLSRVFEFDGSVTLQNLTVTGGTGTVPVSSLHAAVNGDGGAISNNTGAALTIDHVAVTNSTASISGGGIGGTGNLTADHSEISGNTAGSGQGGGIAQSNVKISNSTVSGNQVTHALSFPVGGGIWGSNELTSLNNTIASNQVTLSQITAANPGLQGTAGAGIASFPGDFFGLLQNTVLANNLTDAVKDNCNQTYFSNGGNVADDSTCGVTSTNDKQGVDPKLGALANNGGQTRTHAIGTDSPAFDNAVSGSGDFGTFLLKVPVFACPSTDQRDLPRPQFAACDSGAYELQPTPPATKPTVTPAAPAQAVLAQQVTAAGPTLRIAGARAGCARLLTRVRVRLTAAGGVRNVKVTLGRRIIKNTKSTNFVIRVSRSQLRVGHNVLKVVVTDNQNRHVVRRAPLTRCAVRVAPHFTG